MNQTDQEKEDLKLMAEVGLEADEFYEEIISRCDLRSDDPLVRAALIGELKQETRQQLVLSIWKNMSDEQAKHFVDFQRREFKINPEKDQESILIEFALLYPALMENVYIDLAEFFILFVVDFNEIQAA